MASSITLRYDRKTVAMPMNAEIVGEVLSPRLPEPLPDVARAVDEVLDAPCGGPAFNDFFRPGDQVVIVVSDITRYTAAERFLPLLVERLNGCGIPDGKIDLIFALGIHRPMSRKEQEKVAGAAPAGRIALHNHDARDRAQLVSLGTTSRGTPVAVNRRAAEADKLLVTGTIGFHYLAGFGGGRKSIIPGIAAYETAVANHLLTLDPAGTGRHPHARTAVLEGNPMHEDMMEACALIPPAFLFNTVLSPAKEILHVVAGDMAEAFSQGCAFYAKHFACSIANPADLVIVSCGGFPKDINFIQSHKTIDYAMNALRPGGVMIVLAACADGIGSPDFLHWISYSRLADMPAALRRDFRINGQTAYATLLKAQQAHILLMSELSDQVVRSMAMTPVHSLAEALTKAYALLGERPAAYLIPYGSVTLPV